MTEEQAKRVAMDWRRGRPMRCPDCNGGPIIVDETGVCDPNEPGTQCMVMCNNCGSAHHCMLPDQLN
jgi:hypothetical protein